MFNAKKVIMSSFVILTVIAFYIYPSYAQEKPSNDIMKQIILSGYSRGIDKFTKSNPDIKVSNLKYESFKITKGSFSKTPGNAGESTPYNVEVSYKISYIENQNLVKWKADQIKQYEENIVAAQKALKKHEAEANKPEQLIDYDRKSIAGNKQNIEETKKFPDAKKEKKEITKNNDRMYFVKKGEKWYGYLGWK
jgi:hypothetical protein